MRRIDVTPVLSDEQTEALTGSFIDDSHRTLTIDHDCDVFREDGTPLLHFRRAVVDEVTAAKAFPILYRAAAHGGNRGVAAGKLSNLGLKVGDRIQGRVIGALQGDTRYFPIKEDGTISKRSFAIEVPSSVIGALERSSPQIPYCRQSAFTAKHIGELKNALPFIRQVNACFAENSPERYAVQKAVCDRTHPDYIIAGTAFSTVTINRNWRTAAHRDVGDLRTGFGVLSVLSEGRYDGGIFTIPRYGLGVNMRHGDVLLADVHELHGNTELVGLSKYWTRLSTVFYYRRRLVACKSIVDEMEIAKRRKPGQALFFDFEDDFPT